MNYWGDSIDSMGAIWLAIEKKSAYLIGLSLSRRVISRIFWVIHAKYFFDSLRRRTSKKLLSRVFPSPRE